MPAQGPGPRNRELATTRGARVSLRPPVLSASYVPIDNPPPAANEILGQHVSTLEPSELKVKCRELLNVSPCKVDRRLSFQLFVLPSALLQNRDVRVCVFPQCEEILVGFACFRRVATQGCGTPQPQVRERV